VEHTAEIETLIAAQGFLILDGGLATQLEDRGHDLNHPLWSARLVTANPDAIREVHRSYLEAGSDCLITASYQASVPGLIAQGISKGEARSIIARSVSLACEARDDFGKSPRKGETPRLQPMVAASIGPYGAMLADGSEYRGNYGLSDDELRAFHEERWKILAESSADLLACETIPSLQEAMVLQRLLHETPAVLAWMSFSCRDGEHISDGSRLAECAALFEGDEQVVAVGINCTAPRFIASLIAQARLGAPTKRIVVYPNSGEIYDASERGWMGSSDPTDFGEAAVEWYGCGASMIGGCCRTEPRDIRAMRVALLRTDHKGGNAG